MEVRNRFKGLDLIDRFPEELWMELHDIVQEVVIKTIPKKKKCKKESKLKQAYPNDDLYNFQMNLQKQKANEKRKDMFI